MKVDGKEQLVRDIVALFKAMKKNANEDGYVQAIATYLVREAGLYSPTDRRVTGPIMLRRHVPLMIEFGYIQSFPVKSSGSIQYYLFKITTDRVTLEACRAQLDGKYTSPAHHRINELEAEVRALREQLGQPS